MAKEVAESFELDKRTADRWQKAFKPPRKGAPLNAENFINFLRYFVITQDEDAPPGSEVYKTFPYDRLHILTVIDFIFGEGMFAEPEWGSNQVKPIEKGRQMTITWLIMAFLLWNALARAGTRYAIVAQKSDKSEEEIKRIVEIVKRMPNAEFVNKTTYKIHSPDGAYEFSYRSSKSQSELVFPNQKDTSNIHFMTQNTADPRSQTWTMAFLDEPPYLPNALEMYNAIRPSCQLLIVTGTYNGIDSLLWPLTHGELSTGTSY